MIPICPPNWPAILPIGEADAWNITNLSAQAVLVLITWYLITKALPKSEEYHEKQLLGQRADLLTLAQKERELAERVIQIFADAQNVTVKDNHEAILDLHTKADELAKAAREVLDQLRGDTTIKEELFRTRQRLAELEAKHGSNWAGRKKPTNPPEPQ